MKGELPAGTLRAVADIGFNLYLITDRKQTLGRPLADVVHAALDGGIKAVQLREKDLGSCELYQLASKMRSLTGSYGARLFVNDRIDVAMATGADGVHLGIGSLPVAVARRLAGESLLIGYSSHSAAEACRAEADGADFVTLGPIYQTPSKAAYGAPLGVPAMQLACQCLKVPLLALGGIKKNNLPDVIAAGAAGVALISAIMSAADPEKETVSLLKTIEEHATHP